MPRSAKMRLAANLQPDLRLRLEVQITQGAVTRGLCPLPDRLKLIIFGPREEVTRLLQGPPQPEWAQVILPPLQEHRWQLIADDLAHDRNVLADQLLLQVDRVGRNDPPPTSLDGKPRSRQKIRKRFPHPRAGLSDQRICAHQSFSHCDRKLLLLRPIRKISRFRECALPRKYLTHLVAKAGNRLAIGRENHLSPIAPRICHSAKPQLREPRWITRSTAPPCRVQCLPTAANP